MPITGICEVVYGVDDMDACARFWLDYGLAEIEPEGASRAFAVKNSAIIRIVPLGDSSLPAADFDGRGVYRTVLGVESPAALDHYATRLALVTEVERLGEEVQFVDCNGNPMGLRVWNKLPVMCRPDPVNAPDHIVRLNQHRKWRSRAEPRSINHIVYWSDDYVRSYEWYRDYLDFRMTDHSKANGIFARANGTHEHHTLFWLTTGHPGKAHMKGYAHIAFGLEDIDEVMIGANYMLDHGWSHDRPFAAGLNRHRISSALYYYFPAPCGGDAEYHADTDYCDDGWIPRVWEIHFGASLWGSTSPGFNGAKGISWDTQMDPNEASLDAWRGTPDHWPTAR
jgi:catechol 2,3-dioxygenase-like lactoylglutathione lyase family enzyme